MRTANNRHLLSSRVGRLLITVLCVASAIWCGMIFSASAIRQPSSSQQKLTKADIDRMMKELSNWGRWGKEDQLGAMNLITPAKRKQAAMLVKEGVSVSLAHDTNTEPAPDNAQPYEHSMTLTGVGNLSQFSL